MQWGEEADWFAEATQTLASAEGRSREFRECLRKVRSVLVGMGSFMDIPLQSTSGNLADQEQRDLQWKLAADIGEAIEEVLKGTDDERQEEP